MNRQMANKGMGLEALVKYQNQLYLQKGIAKVRKVHTNWIPERRGGQITGAHPGEKSELDFKGCLEDGTAITFDCKESSHPRGLPLANFRRHQIDELHLAKQFRELGFILCENVPARRLYVVSGELVLECYDAWKQNHRKKGYAVIPWERMLPVPETERGPCDYISALFVDLSGRRFEVIETLSGGV